MSIKRFLRSLTAAAALGLSLGLNTGFVKAESVARLWDEQLLAAIRVDTPRPTVHSRNLFHVSTAIYDAWAAYDTTAVGYISNEKATSGDIEAARAEAISYAAYRMLSSRFATSPGAATTLPALNAQMASLGYDVSITTTVGNSPAAVGNRIAQAIQAYGLTDGSNQQGNFADTSGYATVNPTLVVSSTGTTMNDPNRWQPLVVPGAVNPQGYLTPHWGGVTPFAIQKGPGESVYGDGGQPPKLGGVGDAEFKAAAVDVIRFSSFMDPGDGVMIDISPGAILNNSLGANDGSGHAINPVTGLPYAPNVVKQADYGRGLAEFWADGPKSSTPPGHWNEIANTVADQLTIKRIGGTGPVVNDLEFDVKLYFSVNAAVYDAGISAWDHKEFYDYARPISMIRYMGGKGQSSDPSGPSYHPQGLPLEAGLIEVITAATTAAGEKHEHLAGHEGEIAIRSWLGHPADPSGVGGVGWILAGDWIPYQAKTFVTPPFPGYTSGHSTFSRAAAEVLAQITGSEYFPGGMGEFLLEDFLKFEGGPSEAMTLQWATYFDAADQAGLSRLWGGIHVSVDDLAGRMAGSQAGLGAYALASRYFDGSVVPEPATLLLAGLGCLAGLARRSRR